MIAKKLYKPSININVMADNEIDFATGVRLGIGIQMGRCDSAGVKGQAITFDGTQPAGGGGSASQSKYFRAKTAKELSEALDVGVSVAGSYMMFSASAKVNYHESRHSTKTATQVIIKRTAVHSPEYITNPRFTDDALDLIRNGQDDLFDQRYGNTFVEGQITGGAYYATGEFILENEEQQRDFSLEVDTALQLGIGSFSVGVSVDNAVSSSSMSCISVFDENKMGGLVGGEGLATSMEGLEARANAWANEVQNQPIGLKAVIKEYKLLPQIQGLNYYDRRAIREALDAIEVWMVELDDAYKNARFIEDNQHLYPSSALNTLRDIKQSIVDDKNRLFAHASRCMNKPADCIGIAIPDPPTTHFNWPERRPQGGGGGNIIDTMIVAAVRDSPGTEGSPLHKSEVSRRLRHKLGADTPMEGFFTGKPTKPATYAYHLARR